MRSIWEIAGAIERFKELHAQNLSFAQIANEMSAEFKFRVTRNAAIGKAGRLGLPQESKPGFSEFNRKRREEAAKRMVENPTIIRIRKRKPKINPEQVKERVAAVGPQHLSLFDLKHGQCRYPYGERAPYTFCGCQVEPGRPYCEPHQALCSGTHIIIGRAAVEQRKRKYARMQRAAA